jgi:hypothetical protein
VLAAATDDENLISSHCYLILLTQCHYGLKNIALILSVTRASFLMETVSAHLFMWVVGPLHCHSYPTKYIVLWILRGCHSSVSTDSKERIRAWSMTKEWLKSGISCDYFFILNFCVLFYEKTYLLLSN